MRSVAREGRLPVVMFCAGGIATPADAALVMHLGAEGVFVGSGIFKSEDPAAARRRGRRGDDALPGLGPRAEGLRGARRGDALARGAQARRDAGPRQPRLVSVRAAREPAARRGRWPRAGDGLLVGVLALQGGFAAHRAMLEPLGAVVREVRVPADLEDLDGLVLPGGESTTMTLGIEREGLAEPLRAFARGRARRCSAPARA